MCFRKILCMPWENLFDVWVMWKLQLKVCMLKSTSPHASYIDVHDTTLSFRYSKIIFSVSPLALCIRKKIIRDEGATSAMWKTKLSHKKLFFTSLSLIVEQAKNVEFNYVWKRKSKKIEFIFNVHASLSRTFCCGGWKLHKRRRNLWSIITLLKLHDIIIMRA
jgi:hypothetical protein